MQNKLASGARLGRQALLFPLCLVLYEFSTYIGNDMIQPGMLAVVEQYQAGIDWVPTSMTAYLAGGMFLQWLLGPLSDRIGRRPVMLAGVVWFIVTCLAILLAQNIEQFTLLRFLQGISLCFIGAVGYAAIQESFEEAVCIKITALMANVALIAPLLGPLVGAAWIHVLPWEGMFVLFAALAAISFFGLQRAMPETATRIGEKLSLKELGRDYKLVLKNGRFVAGALALGFVSLPLLAWIAQSPIIIITGEQLSSYEYGLLQVPIFGALIAGNKSAPNSRQFFIIISPEIMQRVNFRELCNLHSGIVLPGVLPFYWLNGASCLSTLSITSSTPSRLLEPARYFAAATTALPAFSIAKLKPA